MLATLRFVKFGLVAVVVLLLSLGAIMTFRLWPVGADVPLFKTPDWEGKHIGELNSGHLLVRRETEAGGALLLKRIDLETVYRYDPNTRAFSAVTEHEWLNSRGAIAACVDQRATPERVRIRIDRRNHKMFAGEREVSTAAKIPLSSLTSPTGKWVAVLSATGPVVPALMFFSGDRVLGARHHEIISLSNMVSTGGSTQIPVPNTLTTMQLCWSADEKFVIYHDGNFSSLVVVETPLNPSHQ